MQVKKLRHSININSLVTLGSALLMFSAIFIYDHISNYAESKKNLYDNFLKNEKKIVKNRVDLVEDYLKHEMNYTEEDAKQNLIKKCNTAAKSISKHIENGKSPSFFFKALNANLSFENNSFYIFFNSSNELLFTGGDERYCEDSERMNIFVKKVNSLPEYDLKNGIFFESECKCITNSQGNSSSLLSYIKRVPNTDINIAVIQNVFFLEESVKEKFLDFVGTLRFDDGSYVFIGDYNGLYLRGTTSNTNIYNIQDKSGKLVVRELIRTAKNGSGYVEYIMPPLGSAREAYKLSYVKGIQRWKWYIGTGVYVEKIYEDFLSRRYDLLSKLLIHIFLTAAVIGLVIIVSIILDSKMQEKLDYELNIFMDFFKSAQEKNSEIKVSEFSVYEFAALAIYANEMIRKIRHAETALKESEERFRSAIEMLPVAYAEVDLNLNIIYANKSAFRMSGYEKEDIDQGFNLKNLLPDLNKLMENINVIKQSNYTPMNEYELIKADGSKLPVLVHSIPILDGNKTIGIRSAIIDISDRKRFEEEKRKQQQMMIQSDKLIALGELSAGIAHEINQPLSVLSLGLMNVKYRINSDNPDKEAVLKKLDKLLENVTRIKNLIEHVRTFSREQSEESNESFEVHAGIESALSLISAQYITHSIEIEKNFYEDEIRLKGNIYKFEQVILNLLSNAKDSLEEKSESLPEHKKKINITTRINDGFVFVEIMDNGKGIAKENIDKILNPFFTTKPVDRGTGLGLSVSYGIVRDMNGKINIESLEGSFAKIILSFQT